MIKRRVDLCRGAPGEFLLRAALVACVVALFVLLFGGCASVDPKAKLAEIDAYYRASEPYDVFILEAAAGESLRIEGAQRLVFKQPNRVSPLPAPASHVPAVVNAVKDVAIAGGSLALGAYGLHQLSQTRDPVIVSPEVVTPVIIPAAP